MEQFERVERYLNRIRKLYSGRNNIAWDERLDAKDDVDSFFIYCHHLHDWVAELNKLGIPITNIRKRSEINFSVQICADIANGLKHCKLTKKQWSESSPRVATTYIESNRGSDELGIKGKFGIVTKSGEMLDVLEIAESCWRYWDSLRFEFQILWQE